MSIEPQVKKGKQIACSAMPIAYSYRCDFFQWAEFDDDGDPLWKGKARPS